MDEKSFATELLHEIRQSAKRWFYAFIVMVVLEVITIGTFFWYISLPVDVTTTQVTNGEGELNYIGNDGEINNNAERHNNNSTQGNEVPSTEGKE